MQSNLVETSEVVVSLEVILGEQWMPRPKETCWTPNLMESKGEPYSFQWDSRVHNHHELLLQRRVHRTELQAYAQQVSLNKAFYALLAG
jgi:hypothetical protein